VAPKATQAILLYEWMQSSTSGGGKGDLDRFILQSVQLSVHHTDSDCQVPVVLDLSIIGH